MTPQSTALLIVDLQNDFIHPKGAYARGGAVSSAVSYTHLTLPTNREV